MKEPLRPFNPWPASAGRRRRKAGHPARSGGCLAPRHPTQPCPGSDFIHQEIPGLRPESPRGARGTREAPGGFPPPPDAGGRLARPARLMKGGARAFTLSEICVVVVLFALFSTTALASLNLSLAQWGYVARRINATSSARFAMSTMVNELRQALPNPTSLGYRSLTPAVSPTGVLKPNANARTSTELVFTEVDPDAYNPAASGFDSGNPALYRRVRYYVQGGTTLRREMTTYTSGGSVASTRDDLVARAQALSLSVTWQAADLFDLAVSVTEGNVVVTLNTRAFIVGR